MTRRGTPRYSTISLKVIDNMKVIFHTHVTERPSVGGATTVLPQRKNRAAPLMRDYSLCRYNDALIRNRSVQTECMPVMDFDRILQKTAAYPVAVKGCSLHQSALRTHIVIDILWIFPLVATLYRRFALDPDELGLFLAILEEDRSSMQRGGSIVIKAVLRAKQLVGCQSSF